MSLPIRWLRAAFDLFLFSSLYLALSAMAMVWQSLTLFGLPVPAEFLGFVFFGTICSYNLHWYLTPSAFSGSYKTQWSVKNKGLHEILFLIGLAGSGYSILRLLTFWPWLLTTAFITFLYTAPKVPFSLLRHLKKIAVGKTIFLAYAWTHITAFLPLVLYEPHWRPTHYLFVLNRFFLLYPICILFDYRDREEDKQEGIRSLITMLTDKGISIIFWGSLAVFFATCLLLSYHQVPFSAVAALTIPGIILAGLYQWAKRNFSDYLYYFVLDGLMVLSSLLLSVIHF